MSALADSLRRARELYLDGRVHGATATDGWGRNGSARTDRYGLDLDGRLVFWEDLINDACDGVGQMEQEAWRLLDGCSPGGAFNLFADGARWVWNGEHVISMVYDCERRAAEIAAVIGKACVLAEAMPKPRKHRFTPVPVAAPAPNVAGVAIRSTAKDAGYVQDPEEERDDG
jgi:hypothetical protein